MKIIQTLLLVFFVSASYGQDLIKGKVIDKNTNEQLPYVNIGVIGKNIGTVSDINGQFEITIDDKNNKDTLRLSMIGYESLEMIVADFKKQLKNNPTIKLNASVAELKEVVVSGRNLKEKIIGNKTTSKNITAQFTADKLGNEIGVVMKIKNRPTYIKEFNCSIARNTYGKLKFRLNIYELEKGMPGMNILKENIFVETDIEEGMLTVDLTKYNIWVETDFLIALEWIEDLGKDGLHFSARFLGAPMIARETSQGYWGKVTMASVGFTCTVRY